MHVTVAPDEDLVLRFRDQVNIELVLQDAEDGGDAIVYPDVGEEEVSNA